MKKLLICLAVFACNVAAADYPIAMPRMGSVKPTGGFWAAREATNRLVTATANLKQSRDTGRIDNFVNAARKLRGEPHGRFRGIFFNDSDVYKVAEGMAYELAMFPDAAAARELEALVEKFGAAQEPDGYIYTARTLGNRHERVGTHRWYCDDAHELYCMGHMIEAAVAHHETTGKDNFLKVACKAADMMRRTFGPGKDQIWFLPGHEEIELALCKLYKATGNKKYLDLAMDLLSTRGMPRDKRVGERKRGFPSNHAYYQDHLPVREQKEAVGHAVRAGYLYAGMCDVGVMSGDDSLLRAADTIWNDIVTGKLYLSGGVGARPEIEGYGPAFDLPNDRVCLETCAAIANALFNERMFLRSGDAKYLDIVERIAYNGSLCSISISGDEFFYPNPMASRGGYKRSKWFGCACCPPNVVRFIPQFINWAYASDAVKNTFYWNFFMENEADLGRVRLSQKTDYPWSGVATLTVNPARDGDEFTLKIRVPGWARGVPAPGGLYEQTKPSRAEDVRCTVNGKAVSSIPGADGYISVKRAWRRGDAVTLSLPMEVKRIKADDRVAQDRGRLAVERGPLVYCAEGVDNGGRAFNAVLPPDAELSPSPIVIANTPMTALKGAGLTLVPFFAWCHRGAGEMQTWFATSRETASGRDARDARQPPVTAFGAGWRVAELNGAPGLYHDGKPVAAMMFWQWEPQEKDTKDMSAVGMELFAMFGSFPHYRHPYWRKDGSFGMTYQDAHIDNLLSWAPKAAFLPRVFYTAPDWWSAANPSERHVYAPGRKGMQVRESFASLTCREELSPYYRKAVRHLLDRYGDHLMGIHVASGPCGEHFSWDVWGHEPSSAWGDLSEPMRQAFVRYLRRKYGNDVGRLREAFKDPKADFASVALPGKEERCKNQDGWRDPAKGRRVLDYLECCNEVTVEMIDHYCGIVKDEAKGALPTLAFYGYVAEDTWANENDHRGTAKMYLSKNLDMLSAPHSYRRRRLGEDGMQRQYLASAALHGKLFIDEGDDMTHLEKRKKRPDRRCTVTTMEESLALLYREFGMTVTHGTGLWYMDLTRGTFRDPQLVDAVGRMRKWAEVALRHDRSHHSEVAVVSQPQSGFYTGHGGKFADTVTEKLYVKQMGEFYRAGAPFDWYLAEDLDAVVKGKAKVIAFLDCQYLTDEQYALALKLKEQGRTLVFFHAPAYANQTALSWERVKRLTGGETYETLKMKSADELRAIYKAAGVHVYTDSDVVLSANSAWLMLHTREAGDYEIALPRRARKITEITTERPVAENADRFTWKLPKHSTAVFLLEH